MMWIAVKTSREKRTISLKDLRKNMPHFQGDKFTKNLEKVEQLRKIANEKNAEVAHVVLVHLTEEEINEIDRIFK